MERPTLQQLSYLVALAEHHHFGRAAAACHVTQPALSSQLRELERRLGVTLVERSARGARLTPAGIAAAARARIVLTGVDELAEEAADAAGEVHGPFGLGVIPTIAPYLLGRLVPTIVSRFPHAELRLEELRTAELLSGLRAGDVDLGLCALPVPEPDLATEALADDPFLLAVPADHALAGGQGPVAIEELARHRVLLLEDGHCLRDQALSVCDLVGTQPTDVSATSLPTLVQMVAAGGGITLLPASAAAIEARPGNGIAVRRIREPVHRTIGFVWRATSPRGDSYRELARLTRPLLP